MAITDTSFWHHRSRSFALTSPIAPIYSETLVYDIQITASFSDSVPRIPNTCHNNIKKKEKRKEEKLPDIGVKQQRELSNFLQYSDQSGFDIYNLYLRIPCTSNDIQNYTT